MEKREYLVLCRIMMRGEYLEITVNKKNIMSSSIYRKDTI